MHLPEIEIPAGYERNEDLNHVLKNGEPLYFKALGGWELSEIYGFDGKTIKEIYESNYGDDYICLKVKGNKMKKQEDLSHLIPEGYEVNTNSDDLIIDGDYFLTSRELRRFLGHTGKTIKWANDLGVRVLKKIEYKTPEEKINYIKGKSKKFVDKNINNPTKETYLKFEKAFLDDTDFGK